MYLHVAGFTVGPLAENSYLLRCTTTGAAVFVDPGYSPRQLIAAAEKAGVRLEAILLTHAHLDHVGALTEVREHFQVPVYLHPADDELLAQAHLIWQQFGLTIGPIAPAEHPLADGQTFTFGAVSLAVIHTPGHTPGGVCFYAANDDILIAGDTLFHRSVGRTDLPGGDFPTLQRSIHEQLFTLPHPERIVVYPGHGSPTTIREEMEENPFVGIRRIA